jgi:phosphomethylpyrimidine synthase
MAKRRDKLDWKGQIELSMDPEKAQRYRDEGGCSYKGDACSMCGSYCAIKVYKRATSPQREKRQVDD